MAPALDITLVGQEMAACAALGAALGGARALFPEKGRAAFLPDVLLVGALLLGLQSYAAALSAGGVLRWYQLAAAVLAAAAVHKLLRGPMQFARTFARLDVRQNTAQAFDNLFRVFLRDNALLAQHGRVGN